MAKLTTDTPHDDHPADDSATERQLRARIAELEALLEARTQTIVGLGARVAELTGDAPPSLLERARSAEAALERLSATKVMRYSRVPRRVYTSVRRWWRG